MRAVKTKRARPWRLGLLGLAIASTGCAGGAPLLHPAHVLRPGNVAVSGGLSGRFAPLNPPAAIDGERELAPALYDDLGVASGIAPFVAGRVGIEGDNEAGLTYTARAVRLDGRHAFDIAPLTLSLGLGGSFILPKNLGDDEGSIKGGGADVPILLGWKSDADLYALWFGPRVGFEVLDGQVSGSLLSAGGDIDRYEDVSGYQVYMGGLLGLRIGFRSIFVAAEVDVSYHLGSGTLGGTDVELSQVSITPGSSLWIHF